MLVSNFDFHLPEELIALRPVSPRHSARQLVVQGANISDKSVWDMTDYLRAGDLIVFNDTKVIPSYLFATRGKMATEINLHKRVSATTWLAFAKKPKRLRTDDMLDFGSGRLQAHILEIHEGGRNIIAVRCKCG